MPDRSILVPLSACLDIVPTFLVPVFGAASTGPEGRSGSPAGAAANPDLIEGPWWALFSLVGRSFEMSPLFNTQ